MKALILFSCVMMALVMHTCASTTPGTHPRVVWYSPDRPRVIPKINVDPCGIKMTKEGRNEDRRLVLFNIVQAQPATCDEGTSCQLLLEECGAAFYSCQNKTLETFWNVFNVTQ